MALPLDTIAYHICEKPGLVPLPDVNGVYQQILAMNNGKYPNILLLPEYNGHLDWDEELAWIIANFGGTSGIPIMLEVFGGGMEEDPTPQLTTQQISAAMAAANVKSLRFSEVISWHLENEKEFPTAYVSTILAFAETNGLEVVWNEWKIGEDVFENLATYIAGYEDIVTVTFATNSGELEPAQGFEKMKGMFQHWGGSIQHWYWETRHRNGYPPEVSNPDNMPGTWLIEHALICKEFGAELIQFESYTYFFGYTESKATDDTKLLHFYLNSALSSIGKDFERELRDLLWGNWALLQEGYKKDEDIEFHIGYVTLQQIPSGKKEVQIGHTRGTSSLLNATSPVIEMDQDVSLTCSLIIKAAQDTVPDVEAAKEWKWVVKREIERILSKEQLPPGWEWAFVSAMENRDKPFDEPPLLEENLTITVKHLQIFT